jgi:hypothetical protein
MDEYVQYHNPEYAEFPVEGPGLFSIYTRKAPHGIQGSRIWLVARKRDTREYYLVYWFIVDAIVPGEAGEPNSIEGRSGAWLRPIVRIDQLPWFDAFLKYMGNFGLGLQKIADPALVTALRAAGDTERWVGEAPISFAAEIKEALENVSVSPIQQTIIRELAKQPQSAPDLTSRLGLRHFVVVNGALGRLGRDVRARLSSHPDGFEDGEYQWWTVLATAEKHDLGWVWSLRPEVQAAAELLGWLQSHDLPLPEEAGAGSAKSEGAVRTIVVNRYERDPDLRAACIAKYGARCFVCSADMGSRYGDYASGFIHVHHLTPLSEMGGEANVDPVHDLRPLCPNCHSVVHLRTPPFSMDEMHSMWSKHGEHDVAAER